MRVCIFTLPVFWTVHRSSGALFAALITANFRDYISSSTASQYSFLPYLLACPLLILFSILPFWCCLHYPFDRLSVNYNDKCMVSLTCFITARFLRFYCSCSVHCCDHNCFTLRSKLGFLPNNWVSPLNCSDSKHYISGNLLKIYIFAL